MDIHQNRLDNMMRLASRYKSDREFAAACGINHTYIPQLKSGLKRLGHQLVRRIEINLGLEPGWMDHDHSPPKPQPPPDTQPDPRDAQMRAVSAAMASLPVALREQVARMVFEMSISCTNNQERPRHVEPFRIQEHLDLGDTQTREASSQ